MPLTGTGFHPSGTQSWYVNRKSLRDEPHQRKGYGGEHPESHHHPSRSNVMRCDLRGCEMTIYRGQFLAGLGAAAVMAPLTVDRAAAQLTPKTQVYDLGNQGALYRIWLDLGQGPSLTCTAAVLPRRAFAASIMQQTSREGALSAVSDAARTAGATVAINGGYFNGAFAPDGLLIVDGKIVGQKRADWMGYLVIDGDGNASVTSAPHLRLAKYAVQGNPMIIEPGRKIGIVREDNQRFRRTVIAQSGDLIIAMVTTPVSLFSLAYALIERPDAFYVNRIDAALNMSGAATTSFYAKPVGSEAITVPAFWPNRDVITFVPRVV